MDTLKREKCNRHRRSLRRHRLFVHLNFQPRFLKRHKYLYFSKVNFQAVNPQSVDQSLLVYALRRVHQDFDLLKSIHHEDFMFVREFSMSSREEHLAKLKERLPTSTLHKRVQCVHEDDNVLVMRKSDIDDNGIAYFTSNVSIKHEGLYWRTMVKKDE